jgi:NAD(P)H dehydrogenase (quinone)
MNLGPILVTGAGGKTGRAVVRTLVERGCKVRAAVRRESHRKALETLDVRETVVFDLEETEPFEKAANGVQAVYHIPPNVHPQELKIGRNAIHAARKAGVEHFAYHSVLWPQIEAMPHHWQKLRVEEALIGSGLPFTILQPCAYMQNSLAQLDNIQAHGVFEVPYSVETRFSLVDLEDVARAAVRVLTEPDNTYAVYTCCGPQAISSAEIAELFSSALSKQVAVRALSLSDWRATATAEGLGGYPLQALLQMFRYYDRHDFVGSPAPLAGLLGRPPTTFEQFLNRSLR